MIADAGFVVEAAAEPTLPAARRAAGVPVGTGASTGPARTDLVRVRRRGAGTDLPPDA